MTDRPESVGYHLRMGMDIWMSKTICVLLHFLTVLSALLLNHPTQLAQTFSSAESLLSDRKMLMICESFNSISQANTYMTPGVINLL